MKYIYIALTVMAVIGGIYFAGDLIKVVVAGLLTAGFAYFAYREYLNSKKE